MSKEFSITIESGREPTPAEVQVNLTRLSYSTGYSVSHLSRILSKETRPSIRCMVKLAGNLGVTLDQLHSMIQEGKISASKIS